MSSLFWIRQSSERVNRTSTTSGHLFVLKYLLGLPTSGAPSPQPSQSSPDHILLPQILPRFVVMSSRLQRPAPPVRSTSASSFAETFSAARSKVEKDLAKQDKSLADLDEQSGSDTDATPALDNAYSSDSSPPSIASPLSGPVTPENELDVADDFAFAFDIDGVLIRGGQPIPEAVEAMKVLNGENEWGIRVSVHHHPIHIHSASC